MKYHVALIDRIDIEKRRSDVANGLGPRHFCVDLAEKLGAEIYEPETTTTRSPKPTLFHKVMNISPKLISLADDIVENCDDDDVVFCIGEGIALPIAYALKKQKKQTKLLSFGHNLYRPRISVANALWGVRDRVDKFLVFTEEAEQKSPKNILYLEQTDDIMFSPGQGQDSKPDAKSPIIVSIGLEKRDNLTLAKATEGMDVDIRITAFSRDAKANPSAVPDPMPPNMSAQFYPWPDLVELYRSADLVVVPILPTNYAAGITSILEAAAIGKAIIATKNPALIGAVADPNIAIWVLPEDPSAMRSAIQDALANPDKRKALGKSALEIQRKYHSFLGQQAFVLDQIQNTAR